MLVFPPNPSYLLYGCNNIGNWGADADASQWDMSYVDKLVQVFPYPCTEACAWDMTRCSKFYYPFNKGTASMGTEMYFGSWFADGSGIDCYVEEIEGLVSNPGVTRISFYFNDGGGTQMFKYLRTMKDTFAGCVDVKEASFVMRPGNFATALTTEISGTFDGCESLESCTFGLMDGFNLEEMPRTFRGCKKLSYLDFSMGNCQNVWNVDNFFEDCKSLRSVDISNWILNYSHQQLHVDRMFAGCDNLRQIIVNMDYPSRGNWTPHIYGDASTMFENSPKLPSYDPNLIDRTMAKIVADGGYFDGDDESIRHWWYKWNHDKDRPTEIYWEDGRLWQK